MGFLIAASLQDGFNGAAKLIEARLLERRGYDELRFAFHAELAGERAALLQTFSTR